MFSACTEAVFVVEGERNASLEKIYTAVVALAAAHHRQRDLNVKCKCLQESGASEVELCNTRKRAAMVNQIEGGFQTSANWPQWLGHRGLGHSG